MTTKQVGRTEPDYILIMTVATLVAIGLLMVYSASYNWAVATDRRPAHYFVRQCIFAGIGIAAAVIMYKVNVFRWQKWAIPVLLFALVALLLVLLAGESRFGSISTLFAGSVQPSELAKLAMVIYLATWLSSKGEKVRDLSYGLLPFGVLLGLVTGLIVLQPDLGAAVVIVSIALAMFFLAGADAKQVILSLIVGTFTFALIFLTSQTAQDRISRFLEMVRDPQTGGHPHVRLAIQALARGGPLGAGITDGVYKRPGGVPLPFSDSIFPILGEEMGLVGTWLVLALFGILAYRGFRIALRTRSPYGMLLASGITCWFIFQALINIAVNTAMAPYTGITLPFISQGGSSLIACLTGVGLLANISQYANQRGEEGSTLHEALDVGRRDGRTRLSSPRGGRSTPSRARSVLMQSSRPRARRGTAPGRRARN